MTCSHRAVVVVVTAWLLHPADSNLEACDDMKGSREAKCSSGRDVGTPWEHSEQNVHTAQYPDGACNMLVIDLNSSRYQAMVLSQLVQFVATVEEPVLVKGLVGLSERPHQSSEERGWGIGLSEVAVS
jgi:hypothetical protein